MEGIYEIIAELKLRDRRANLLVQLNEIRATEKEFLAIRKRYAGIWHSVKDPMLKKELHKEINKLDNILAVHVLTPKSKILDEIRAIDITLDIRPSGNSRVNYLDHGNYGELNYNEILDFGIKGIRL